MELIFRTVDPDSDRDVEQFNELMDQLLCRAYDQDLLRSRIREANANPDKYLLAAENTDTGALVGTVLGVCFGDFCETCNPVMSIENVVTHDSVRGKGVARAMLAEMEAWGRRKQAVYTNLCSSNHRHEAHQIYKASGYEDVRGFRK